MADSTNSMVPTSPVPGPVASLFLLPFIGKRHGRPAVATPFGVQATQARKQHMWPCDHNLLAREPGQHLLSSRKSRSWVDVEHHRDLRMLQLDALSVDGVSPKQDLFPL